MYIIFAIFFDFGLYAYIIGKYIKIILEGYLLMWKLIELVPDECKVIPSFKEVVDKIGLTFSKSIKLMLISFGSDIIVESCPIIASGFDNYDNSTAYVIFHVFLYYILILGLFSAIKNWNDIN